VTSNQAHELEKLAERTHSTDADLLTLARVCSQDAGLEHLGNLTRESAGEMIATLRDYERYMVQVEAAQYREAMLT
jgi:hypothetical protein